MNRTRRLIIAALLLLLASPVAANWNILFETSGTAGVTYTCTAYYRFGVQAHPSLAIDASGSLLVAGGLLTSSSWTSATCNYAGPFPGSSGATHYFNIPDTSVDPNLPNVQVIACVRSVASDGTTSSCLDAVNFAPNDTNNPLKGGATNAAVASAAAQ